MWLLPRTRPIDWGSPRSPLIEFDAVRGLASGQERVMTPLRGKRRFAVIVLALASFQPPSHGFAQEKKVTKQRLPEGLRLALAKRTDEYYSIQSFTLSPDGQRVAISYHQDTGIWNIRTEEKHPSVFPVMRTLSMLFTSDGKTLLTADGQQGLVAWDLEMGKRLRTYSPDKLEKGNHFSLHGSALAPSGDVLASSVNGTIRFWKFADGSELTKRRIAPPKDFGFMSAAYSPDGARLFGGTHCYRGPSQQPSPGADVHVWDSDSQRLVMTLA